MSSRLTNLILVFLLMLSACLMIPAQASSVWPWSIQFVGQAINASPICFALDSNGYPHIAFIENNFTYVGLTYTSWNGSAWSIQNLPSFSPKFGVSLALDADNNPHFCYDNRTGAFEAFLNYLSWTGSKWAVQTITQSDSQSITEEDLAIDSQGNPHTLFIEGDNLMYASWTGANWAIQKVDTVVAVGGFHSDSFVLDKNNYPHVLYGIQTGVPSYYGEPTIVYTVKYAYWTGKNWSIQTVFTNVTSFSNVALDSNGIPHFTYTINGPLKYASKNGASWTSQTIDSKLGYNEAGFYASDVCFSGGLAIDKHNNPHVSYWRVNENTYSEAENTYTDEGLMYAYRPYFYRWLFRAFSSWNIQEVDSNLTIYGAGPIALDASGDPHIVYPVLDPFYHLDNIIDIKYAALTGSTTTSLSPAQLVAILSIAVVVLVIVLVVTIILHRRKSLRRAARERNLQGLSSREHYLKRNQDL